MPRSWNARRTPSAIWSFAAKTAVTSGSFGEFQPGLVAGARRPVAAQHFGRDDADAVECVGAIRRPQLRLVPVRRSRDVPHRPVAEVEQVLGRQPRTRTLIDRHHAHVLAELGLERDDRQVRAAAAHGLDRAAVRRDHDQAVDALRVEQRHARCAASSPSSPVMDASAMP